MTKLTLLINGITGLPIKEIKASEFCHITLSANLPTHTGQWNQSKFRILFFLNLRHLTCIDERLEKLFYFLSVKLGFQFNPRIFTIFNNLSQHLWHCGFPSPSKSEKECNIWDYSIKYQSPFHCSLNMLWFLGAGRVLSETNISWHVTVGLSQLSNVAWSIRNHHIKLFSHMFNSNSVVVI